MNGKVNRRSVLWAGLGLVAAIVASPAPAEATARMRLRPPVVRQPRPPAGGRPRLGGTRRKAPEPLTPKFNPPANPKRPPGGPTKPPAPIKRPPGPIWKPPSI